ncbi:tetrahydromethanopterin S-methyltransferase subunit F [Fontibacillus solani]|uniref:Tetrahydromethanopterin S-methyltransferase subunit F n=1 Tax=Fontibacillus solani TaxID=1572857 RepID=A0A7W3SRR3_9BACL|nr:hypothetical protein [Fontibacillus solani]MBA9084864.1 tetrahydromethanopterin S-methyltransferase subunit F [Fontibacillus solani]
MEVIRPEYRPSHKADRYGFAVTSFIASMIGGLVFSFLFVGDPDQLSDGAAAFIFLLWVVLPILGIVFGSLSLSSMRGKGLAIAGFVISIIILVLLIFFLFVGLLLQ